MKIVIGPLPALLTPRRRDLSISPKRQDRRIRVEGFDA